MTKNNTKNIIALTVILSIIGGFFAGVISSDFFYATIGMIISHFYQVDKINKLKDTVEAQSVKINSLE
jgi:hypothetical protein